MSNLQVFLFECPPPYFVPAESPLSLRSLHNLPISGSRPFLYSAVKVQSVCAIACIAENPVRKRRKKKKFASHIFSPRLITEYLSVYIDTSGMVGDWCVFPLWKSYIYKKTICDHLSSKSSHGKYFLEIIYSLSILTTNFPTNS